MTTHSRRLPSTSRICSEAAKSERSGSTPDLLDLFCESLRANLLLRVTTANHVSSASHYGQSRLLCESLLDISLPGYAFMPASFLAEARTSSLVLIQTAQRGQAHTIAEEDRITDPSGAVRGERREVAARQAAEERLTAVNRRAWRHGLGLGVSVLGLDQASFEGAGDGGGE